MKSILEKNKVGNFVPVPVNCFIENTSYKYQFNDLGKAQKMQIITRPNNMGRSDQKFTGASMYNQFYGSTHTPKQLLDRTLEQKKRTAENAFQQRRGTLGAQTGITWKEQPSMTKCFSVERVQ